MKSTVQYAMLASLEPAGKVFPGRKHLASKTQGAAVATSGAAEQESRAATPRRLVLPFFNTAFDNIRLFCNLAIAWVCIPSARLCAAEIE